MVEVLDPVVVVYNPELACDPSGQVEIEASDDCYYRIQQKE